MQSLNPSEHAHRGINGILQPDVQASTSSPALLMSGCRHGQGAALMFLTAIVVYFRAYLDLS